jgi:hypothetical protein
LTDRGPIVNLHLIGSQSFGTRTVPRRLGQTIEMRFTPLADCQTCPKTYASVACACCGRRDPVIAVDHATGEVTCTECLANRVLGDGCGHAPARDQERHAMN